MVRRSHFWWCRMNAIRDKGTMYAMLAAGRFGNTVPQWFSVDAWEIDPGIARFGLWGVRSARRSGHPAMRLHVPTAEVATYARQHFADGPNISPMIDAVSSVTLMADVWDSPRGLVVSGVEYPPPGTNWRSAMLLPATWEGLAARRVLARHLNPNSLADLWEVLDAWPCHCVELSATDRCIGTVPHRNAIVWEVRATDGSYEQWGARL